MRIVATGYASLDYAVRLDRAPQVDRTATILSRAPDWPRLGGSPAYVCAALVAAGAGGATPVSWIGDDADGQRYLEALRERGVPTDGVATRPGRTPACILAYEPAGGCHCFYDPGLSAPGELDDVQRALIAEAECLCLTVGPAGATREALRLARPWAQVVWAVKADRRATPPELAAELAARADVVVHSRGETAFVEEAFAAAPQRQVLRIETSGRDGVTLSQAGETEFFPVQPVDCEDATGAGDTFLGGFLAAFVARGESPGDAVAAGNRAARDLLSSRRP